MTEYLRNCWYVIAWSAGRPVDHWLDMRWDPAGVMFLEVRATLAGRPAPAAMCQSVSG